MNYKIVLIKMAGVCEMEILDRNKLDLITRRCGALNSWIIMFFSLKYCSFP